MFSLLVFGLVLGQTSSALGSQGFHDVCGLRAKMLQGSAVEPTLMLQDSSAEPTLMLPGSAVEPTLMLQGSAVEPTLMLQDSAVEPTLVDPHNFRQMAPLPHAPSVLAAPPERRQPLSPAIPGGRTPMTETEARLHLELAYRTVVLAEPPARILFLLLAQWALETARGQSMWGYNFGGIKATNGGVRLGTRESFGASERRRIQPFRKYPSASEGAKDFIQTLATDFPRAFSELHSGVAERFAQALADEGYFTGSPSEYRRSIALLATEYERKWLGDKGTD